MSTVVSHATVEEAEDIFRKGYGKLLFRYACLDIKKRPIKIKATLNAVAFYDRLGCIQCGLDSMRRHGHALHFMKMALR